ncbi:MAG: C25 family cysteine peptidase [Candidatus Hatepunaea meridiana]|nr:C25 family cysteine peptidase [Candidatus Hatepunaea meridiana]
MKQYIFPLVAVLLFCSTAIQAEHVNFVDRVNADVMVITHDNLRTIDWQPGQINRWETELLNQKADQGYAVGLIQISNDDDQDDIIIALLDGDVNFEFILIIGDACRPCSDKFDDPDKDGFDLKPGADGVNLVPIYREVIEDTEFGDIVIETDQGYIDDEELNGVSIGRIPAGNPPEIRDYIAKADEYIAMNNPDWARSMLVVSDNEYCSINHCSGRVVDAWNITSERIWPTHNWSIRKLLTSETEGNAAARAQDFEDEINIEDYTPGLIHINSTQAHEDNLARWYYDNSNWDFSNEGRYPFMLANSCDLLGFDDFDYDGDCVVEELLMMPDAGIIGAVGFTSPCLQDISGIHAKKFWYAIFRENKKGFGEIFNRSLELSEGLTYNSDFLLRALTLLGDPTLRLPYSNFNRIDLCVAFSPHYIANNISIANGNILAIEPGVEVCFASGVSLTIQEGGTLLAEGNECSPIIFKSDQTWNGIKFESSLLTNTSSIEYCEISNANKGIDLIGQSISTNALIIENCTISDCQYGIYANNSYFNVKNCEISDCEDGVVDGKGIYLVNCSAGMVTIDGNEITGNGFDETYSSAGVFLSYSSPEIINNTIEYNTGSGVACFSSTPDLDASGVVGNNFNTIQSNGGETQSGSDGSEIYLAYNSYPNIKKNNVVDYDPFLMTPIGYMVYKDPVTCNGILTAKYNWWGADPADGFFYWGNGNSITYEPAEGSEITADMDDYELAMRFWDEGDYERASRLFRRTANDTGSIGINSVHYLFGCQLKMREPNLQAFRRLLQGLASHHSDRKVAQVARRFATHCLTMRGDYQRALSEYDNRRDNADCAADSILAVVDYLAVCELAGIRVRGNRGESIGYEDDIPMWISKLLSMEADISSIDLVTIPGHYSLDPAYPNPFNAVTHIRYGLPDAGYTTIMVYDIQGRELEILINDQKKAGYHSIVWDGSRFASGIYFYRIQSGTFKKTRKMTVLK